MRYAICVLSINAGQCAEATGRPQTNKYSVNVKLHAEKLNSPKTNLGRLEREREIKPTQQTAIIQRLVADKMAKSAGEIRLQTVQQMYAVVLTVLHDKWDFNAADLVKIFEQCTKQFDCINDKYVKIDEFYNLLETFGIKVK